MMSDVVVLTMELSMQTKYRNSHKVILRQLDNLELDEAWIWCNTTLDVNWSTDWDYWFNIYGYEYYYFEDKNWSVWTFSTEDDALIFKLIWG